MDQKEIIQKAVKGKFKGHQTLNAKVAPIYPSALESQSALHCPCTSAVHAAVRPSPYCHAANIGSSLSLKST